MAKTALKIHAFLLEAKVSMTEAEIRHVIGDNPGTGAALRYRLPGVECIPLIRVPVQVTR
jgi:hypothetical protein